MFLKKLLEITWNIGVNALRTVAYKKINWKITFCELCFWQEIWLTELFYHLCIFVRIYKTVNLHNVDID